MEPQEPEKEEQEEETEEKPVPLRGWFLFALIVVAFGWLAYRSYPAHHPIKKDPGFIDNIFANNLVLFAARLVLFSAAFVLAGLGIYVIYSIARGMLAGQILTKFGPLEMQAVQDLSADVEMWQNLWSEADEENQQLRQRLEETDADFGELYEAYQRATEGKREDKPHG